jgi:hypothetical protein
MRIHCSLLSLVDGLRRHRVVILGDLSSVMPTNVNYSSFDLVTEQLRMS